MAPSSTVWLDTSPREGPATELEGQWVAHVTSPSGDAFVLAANDEGRLLRDLTKHVRADAGLVIVPTAGVGDAKSLAALFGPRARVEARPRTSGTLPRFVPVIAVEDGSAAGVADHGVLASLTEVLHHYDRRLAPWALHPAPFPFVLAMENERHFAGQVVSLFACESGRRVVQVLPSGAAGDAARGFLEWCSSCPNDFALPAWEKSPGLDVVKAYIVGGRSRSRRLLAFEAAWLCRVVAALGTIAFEVLEEMVKLTPPSAPSSRRGRTSG